MSAILYCFYCQELFDLLKKRRSGSWINGNYCGIFGYSDDNVLIAPSKSGLQDMLNTCEEFAASHNLQFSTDPNPRKCKTKCMAFLKKERIISPMKLCGNDLPWVNYGDDFCKHLGNIIENKIDGMTKDIKVKKAKFVQKTNELLQEFSFADPKIKLKMMKIYNSHFYGSPLWDLFGKECISYQKTYNKIIRKIFDLPRETHKFFIEPISESTHMKTILINRFLTFCEKLKSSDKTKNLFNLVKNDARSVTGNNLRKIMLLVDKDCIVDLVPNDADKLVYCEVNHGDEWKVNLVKELTELKFDDNMSVENMSKAELEEILNYSCIS